MFSLPRGTGISQNVPLATAMWESPRTIDRYFYQDNSYIFVGASIFSDAMPTIKALFNKGQKVISLIENSTLPPLERQRRIQLLKKSFSKVMDVFSIPIGLNDDRHFITIAGSRSGKGTSAIIPNLCLYGGSVICLDPKGENAMLTAERRGKGNAFCQGLGQEVFVIDPFGIVKNLPADMQTSFNPLSLLHRESPSVVEDASLLAEALVVSSDSRSAHWDESARNIITGIILHLITKCRWRKPTLLTLRQFLTAGDIKAHTRYMSLLKRYGTQDDLESAPTDAFWYLLQRMEKNQAFNGVINGAAHALASCGSDERGSILSTARRNTAFLDTNDDHYQKTLSGREWKTLDPHIFKTAPKGATLYLCLPAQRMGTHGRWLRLVIAQLFEKMYTDTPPAGGVPVLFLLEEFYSLGYMSVIEKAAGYAAGFGVKLWAILQDLQQLKTLYPSSWQTFIANAGTVQVFGVSDMETTDYVSKALGEVQSYQHTFGKNYSENESKNRPPASARFQGIMNANTPLKVATALSTALNDDAAISESKGMNTTQNQGIHITPLLRPDEIAMEFARETGAQLLIIKGRLPVWCLRTEYFKSSWFKGLYTPQTMDNMPRLDTLPPFGIFSKSDRDTVLLEYETLLMALVQ